MAKYVGKIYEVNNNSLGLRGNGTHKVYIQWYNPFKRVFMCKVITSLEDKTENLSTLKNSRKTNTFITKRSDGNFYVFDKGKYERLRNGDIIPIPMSKTEGIEVWSGYEHIKTLGLNVLRKSTQTENVIIKKK